MRLRRAGGSGGPRLAGFAWGGVALALAASSAAGQAPSQTQVAPSPGPATAPAASPPTASPSVDKTKPDPFELEKAAGVAAFERNDFTTATDHFRRLRQLRPTDDEAMFLLGRAYLATGAAQSAADQFTSAIALNDKADKYFYARAKAEMKLGQYAAAVADFNRDLELRTDKATAIFFLSRGDAYLDNGETDLAIGDYDAVIALSGDLHTAHLHRGIALARKHELARARDDINAAEAAGRAAGTLDFETYFYRGAIEELSADKTSALRDYKAAAAFTDPRKRQAECLVLAGEGVRHHLFGPSTKGCAGVTAEKVVQSPPTPY